MMRRVCYIGSFTGPTDEGMRNVADNLMRVQARNHEVLGIDPASILFRPRVIKSFNPDVIHYLSGPTFLSLILLKIAQLETTHSRTVVTATHPWLPGIRFFSRIFKPDIVFAQSQNQKRLLERLFDRTVFVPNGVDLDRFKPMDEAARKKMRTSLGIDESEFLVMHVGNMREGRNLDILARLSLAPGFRVLLISSTSVGFRSERVASGLRATHVQVIEEFVPRIQDYYGAADCYVFPTQETGRAIELPLSVLEAMACNVPVVSTSFGGLPDILHPNEWFRFADSPKEFERDIHEIKRLLEEGEEVCNTRNQVLSLSWEEVAGKINEHYDEVVITDSEGRTRDEL